MSVVPPDESELSSIAEQWGLKLSADELTEYVEVSAELLDSYVGLDEYVDTKAATNDTTHRDSGWYPEADENRHGGWAWRCCLKADTANGSLAGTEVAVKDNIAVANLPLRNGSAFFDDYTPDEDATVVSRLLAAGTTITGKATASAFCLDALGLDCHPTTVRNPYQTDRAPGGSSTGCGVLVATGAVDYAIGSDQGGSIRIPASWSGCCGLKPTHGLVPYTGAIGLEERIDHLGPMATTVAGCAEVLDAIAGPDGADSRQRGKSIVPARRYVDAEVDPAALRVGVLAEGFGLADVSEPEVDTSVRSMAHSLANAGVAVQEVSAPGHAAGLLPELALVLEGTATNLLGSDHGGVWWQYQHSPGFLEFRTMARNSRLDSYPPSAKLIALLGSYLSQRYARRWYVAGHRRGHRLAHEYDQLLGDVDVLLLPTTPMRAVSRTNLKTVRDYVAAITGNTQNTIPFNVTGHPALSVPTELVNGLPVGAMLIGRRGDDAGVLAAGRVLEDVRGPWAP